MAVGPHLRGQALSNQGDSGATLVRREDLDKPEIRDLLFPDIQRWLKGQ